MRVNVGGRKPVQHRQRDQSHPPHANTPLAETLWTITGYFAQQASISMLDARRDRPTVQSRRLPDSNSADPLNYGHGGTARWPVCSKSFVLFITDGEPCSDGDLPSDLVNYASGKSDFNCTGAGCPSVAKTTAAGPALLSRPPPSRPARRRKRGGHRGRRALRAHHRPANSRTTSPTPRT